MWMPSTQPDDMPKAGNIALPAVRYSILGVPLAVHSDVPAALDRVDETYAAFRQASGPPGAALVVQLKSLDSDHSYLVCDSDGYQERCPTLQLALIELFGRIVQGMLARLHERGAYAIHAGAAVYRGAALIIAGKSGQGKTTLTLALLGRGLGLLSDEFAVAEPGTQRIMPYRRSPHVRPGTPDLIPELRFLKDRPQQRLGGGIEWALAPADLERAFPGCLAPPAPLRYVLLLDGAPRPGDRPTIAPVPAALATMELLRGTWAASVDFAGGLARLGGLLSGAACGRLSAGALDATLDCVVGWLEAHHG